MRREKMERKPETSTLGKSHFGSPDRRKDVQEFRYRGSFPGVRPALSLLALGLRAWGKGLA